MKFLQTEFWAKFKACHGWNALYFVRDGSNYKKIDSYADVKDKDDCLTVMVRSFSVKFKTFSICYIPMFPAYKSQCMLLQDADLGFDEIPEHLVEERILSSHMILDGVDVEFGKEEVLYSLSVTQLAWLYSKIAELIKHYLPENTICVRFDPALDYTLEDDRYYFNYDFRHCKKLIRQCSNGLKVIKSKTDIQPPDTVILSLEPSEDEILAGMKNKWRYNIRLAVKKGVQVEKYFGDSVEFEEKFDEFYKLFQLTSERDGVSFHNKEYYVDLLRRAAAEKNGPRVTLYLAKHEEDYLAGIITLFSEEESVYLYGASGNIKRNLMAAYLLQWTAIQDAKAYGSRLYDFYGCPPTDDEKHPMHGLFLFKTGFGGTLVHRPGSFDVILKKGDYFLYSLAENLRAWYHKVFKKRFK